MNKTFPDILEIYTEILTIRSTLSTSFSPEKAWIPVEFGLVFHKPVDYCGLL